MRHPIPIALIRTSVTLTLAIVASVAADPVAPEQAELAASVFVKAEIEGGVAQSPLALRTIPAKAQAPRAAAVTTESIRSSDGKLLAYVIPLQPQGYVIVGADTDIRPILGFSANGSFPLEDSGKNVLLHLVQWDVEARLRALTQRGPDVVRRVASNNLAWQSFQRDAPAPPVEGAAQAVWGPWLSTPTWHQRSPFNDHCPIDPGSGNRSLVGCVATAMSQIVYFWQYPDNLTFTSADSYSRGQINVDADSLNLDFPSFGELNSALGSIGYSGDTTEIADLCFAAGISVRMSYGSTSSGANTAGVAKALTQKFGFGSAQADYDYGGIWAQRSDKVIANLKKGWPVQIAIHKSGRNGGHSIVADGYRDDGFVHVNMGWGGSSDAWYNFPTIATYDVIHTVVFDISPIQGWSQVGANERNSYRSPYPAPVETPHRKWTVEVPSELSNYRFKHLVVGTGGRVFAALSSNCFGCGDNPYVVMIHPYGYIEKLIPIHDFDYDINYLTQNRRGEIFFGTGGHTANTSIFRLDPETKMVSTIFSHTTPDAGVFDEPIKIDRDNHIYLVISPKFVVNPSIFYSLTRTGNVRWKHQFSSQIGFGKSMAAIDEARNQVYLNYHDSSSEKSYLACYDRLTGQHKWTYTFPEVDHSQSEMATPAAIGDDGTLYVGVYTTLYALSPSGVKLWDTNFFPSYAFRAPAIGTDGTLYVTYGKLIGSTWHPGLLSAVSPSNGSIRWERELSPALDPFDNMGEIYSAENGVIIVTYDRNDVDRTAGLVDHGNSGEIIWDVGFGGTMAFGPSETMFLIPHEQQASIKALSVGNRGDPNGLGMDFTDDRPPLHPSTPAPSDGAVDLPVDVTLSWSCSDPDGHSLTYDVFLSAIVEDEEAAFVPVATGIAATSYSLIGLEEGVEYAWTIVASDGQAVTEGPPWGFTTEGSLDTDTDSDGILDDGDHSGGVGDTPCTGGSTSNCDDNCVDDANPGQEDCDSDGIGDVCDTSPYPTEDCDDEIDNDCDGATDCNDSDCASDPACDCDEDGGCDAGETQCNCPEDCGTPPATEASCSDGIDNDCDGSTDCNDSDCASDPGCDCDEDGFCDAGETQCNCPEDCGTPPATEASCSDGIDNDCDGLIDDDDPDCGEAPPAPTGVSASDGTFTDRVRVTWNSVSGADQYRVYGCTSSGSTSFCSDRGAWQNGRTYDDTSAIAGTTYWYRVKARNDDGDSPYSGANSGWRAECVINNDCGPCDRCVNGTCRGNCGNGNCEPGCAETCENCPQDCDPCPSCDDLCGNGVCERDECNENETNCCLDCADCCHDSDCADGEECVDGGCGPEGGGTQPVCTSDAQCVGGTICNNGECVICVPNPGGCCGNTNPCVGMIWALSGWFGLRFVGPGRRKRSRR